MLKSRRNTLFIDILLITGITFLLTMESLGASMVDVLATVVVASLLAIQPPSVVEARRRLIEKTHGH